MNLIEAVQYNSIDDVKKILNEGVSPDLDSGKPLILAAYYGFGDIVDLLLEYGANPNIVQTHTNAFVQAVLQGNLNIALKLLNSGIDPNIINIDNGALLLSAIKMENMPMINLLLDAGIILNDQTLNIFIYSIDKKYKLPQLYNYLKQNYPKEFKLANNKINKKEQISKSSNDYLIFIKKSKTTLYSEEKFAGIMSIEDLLNVDK